MKSDLRKLEGGWNIVSLEVDGKEYPPLGGRIEINGDRFVSSNKGAEFEGTVAVDETVTPKTLDLIYDKGPHKGKKSLATYEFVKGEWKLCPGLAGKGRPQAFATRRGSGHALEFLRRGKTQASQTGRVLAKSTAPPTELEGEWRMISCIQNGKPVAASAVACVRRVFRGDRKILSIGGQISAQSRFVLRGSGIEHADPGQSGTFELRGSALKIAIVGGTITEWTRKS